MDQLLENAKSAVLKAGDFLRNNSSRHITAECGRDIKLKADRESETIILNCLEKTGLPVLSEETGVHGTLAGRYWVVDPLDGSMNYLKGLEELTCVSIALFDGDRPEIGVIYRWKEDELFWGGVNCGAYCNRKKIATSKVTKIGHAVLAAGFPAESDYSEKNLRLFIRQAQRFKKIRMLGAAAVMGSFVAAGRIDAYMEDDIMLWDVAAATALVTAAGGIAKLMIKQNYHCDCRLFANAELMEDYDAEIL